MRLTSQWLRQSLWLGVVLGVAVANASVSVAQRVEVAFDDFTNVPLQPFDVANVTVGDGTDWTNIIPGWTIMNTANVSGAPFSVHIPTVAAAYDGWTAMDVDSWIQEQGPQGSGIAPLGRRRARFGRTNNTALIADPDAWDDFPPPAKGRQSYNSYIMRTYDITTATKANLVLSFDWDFVTEDRQIGVVDVSFDGGSTWQNLITIASDEWKNDPVWGAFAFDDQLSWSTNPETDTVEPTQGVFLSGVDFVTPPAATSMIVRFGCIESGNDWWFAVDNVGLTDGAAFNQFEDFEGLTLLPFPEGGVGQAPGDGTDFTQDIPNWVIDNSGMLTRSLERAFDGWALLDAQSWINQQGDQRRSDFFGNPDIFGPRNTVLVADSDAHDDFDVELAPDDPLKAFKEFNSFISRTYDLKNFKNTTVRISFDWEFRAESRQRGLAQVSFDGGNTWVTLLDIDSSNPASLAAVNQFLFLGQDQFATVEAPQVFTFGGAGSPLPATNSNSMILRFGKIEADNNWWFAVDNILVEAEVQNFVLGDADGDGTAGFGDLFGFQLALFNPAGFAVAFPGVNPDEIFDFDADGVFTFGDLNGFVNLLFGN